MKTALNLGCGTRIFKSNDEIQWINLDINEGPGVDLIGDWRNDIPSPTRDGYDLIVAHHTFEHQGCGEQPIKQCYDILKPGGNLIVSVPNLKLLAEMWLRGELPTQIYMTNVYGPYDGTEASRHRWGFEAVSLREALSQCPWSSIAPFDWRAIPGADIARDDRWILCLEAVR